MVPAVTLRVFHAPRTADGQGSSTRLVGSRPTLGLWACGCRGGGRRTGRWEAISRPSTRPQRPWLRVWSRPRPGSAGHGSRRSCSRVFSRYASACGPRGPRLSPRAAGGRATAKACTCGCTLWSGSATPPPRIEQVRELLADLGRGGRGRSYGRHAPLRPHCVRHSSICRILGRSNRCRERSQEVPLDGESAYAHAGEAVLSARSRTSGVRQPGLVPLPVLRAGRPCWRRGCVRRTG